MSDNDLISRARQGDQAAWVSLVTEHQQAIFRLAYLLLGDPHEAEDVAQEAFVRAFRSLNTFDPERGALRPWLLRITSNLASNRRRSLGRYVRALRRVYSGPEPTTSLGERTAEEWEAETLWQAVRRLNRAEQRVLYLRYFLELSEAEMASALDVAPGTVKSRLHRAVGRLRSVVEQEFPALREERRV